MADLKKRKSRKDSPIVETSSEDDSDEDSESSKSSESSESSESSDSSNSSSSHSSSSPQHKNISKKSSDTKTGKSDHLRSKHKMERKEDRNKAFDHSKTKKARIDDESQKRTRRKEFSDKGRLSLLKNEGRVYDKGSKRYSSYNEDHLRHEGKGDYGPGRCQDKYEHDTSRHHHYGERNEKRGHNDRHVSDRSTSNRDHSREDIDKSRSKRGNGDIEYSDRKRRGEKYEGEMRRHNERGSRKEKVRSESEERRARHVREWDKGKRNDGSEGEDRTQTERSDQNKKGNDGSGQQKEEPNFELSGKLTEFTNTYKGVVIKYNEPPEARKTKAKWRIYPFKGEESLPILYIHRQSAYLLGRNRMIADIPIDHPSCSSQHAVLQYRLVDYEKPDGAIGKRVRPYIIDLESSNGTFVNNNKIEPRRYVELKEKDVLKFGFSSREYVVLRDQTPQGDGTEEAGKE